jgi:hypothetical protein
MSRRSKSAYIHQSIFPTHSTALERANSATSIAQSIVAEMERNKLAEEAKARARARAERDEEERARAKSEEEARAKRQAEVRAKSEEEARARAERQAKERAKSEEEEKNKASSPPQNVKSVLTRVGKGFAEEKSKEPPRSVDIFSQPGELLSVFSSGLLSNWSNFASKLVQKQEPKPFIPPIVAPPPVQPIISEERKVIVDERFISAFKDKSKPQNLSDLRQYIEACDFLRKDRLIENESKNFKAFKEELNKKEISGEAEASEKKNVLKRAADVYAMKDPEYFNYMNQMESDAIKANREAQEEAKRKAQEEERRRAQKELKNSKENKPFSGQPLIELPRNQGVLWSEEEIRRMEREKRYLQIQIENGTAKNRNIVGIGFNRYPLLGTPRTKPPREDTNSSYIWSLQKKFDKEGNNFDINASVNSQTPNKYISSRVAEWEQESSQFIIDKKTTNPKNLKDYCEYLIGNIDALKAKESDAEIDKSKLKTLIAFQYLELGKIIYAGTWGNTIGGLNRSDDSSTQKPEIIGKILVTVPREYQGYLKNERFDITHYSISLPNRNELNSSPQNKEYRSYLEKLANSGRIKSTYVPLTYSGSNDWDAKHEKMLKRGDKIDKAKELISVPVIKAADNLSAGASSLLGGASKFLSWAGERANPATIRVSPDKMINENTGLGYSNANPDAQAHDQALAARMKSNEEFQPDRDRRPDATAERLGDSRLARYSAISSHKKPGWLESMLGWGGEKGGEGRGR